MTTTAVRDRVRDDFGLDVQTLEPVTANARGRLWRATAGACRYAVRWTSVATPAAQVALALARTIPQRPQDVLPAPAVLAPPLLTRGGATAADHDGGRLSVAPWLEGPTGRDVELTPPQWTAFGRLVARLHALDPASVPGLARESFDPGVHVARTLEVDAAVARAAAGRLDGEVDGSLDVVARATVDAWTAAVPWVAAVRARAARAGHRLRDQGRDVPLVVAHADAHVGHVVATGPRDVALLDWEHACVAPPEHDLLFVLGGVLPDAPVSVEQAAAFFTGYGRVDIDDDRLAYARCVRALRDLAAAAGTALDRAAAAGVREVALGDLTAHHGIDLTAPSLSRTQRYTFDNAARLVSATDTANGSCTRRDYGFDPNGNRVRVAASIDDGACTMTGGTTSAWAFDAADRVQLGANGVGAYVYDELGRQTTVPAVDTPAGATVGDLTIAYYDTDAARGLTQDGTTTTYQLDPRGRRTTASSTTGAMSSTTTHHYSDTSDNPTWATTASGPETATTRYLSSIAGDLSATLADDSLSIALTDPHGDVLTTLTRVDDNLVPDVANLYDEYGNATTHPNTGALTYGWLGAEQRAADTSGLLLMGARLYSPRTGSFTSVDPITSGNTTAYAYPQDPVNEFDLDGLARTCNFLCVGAAFAVSLATNAGCKVALASVVGLGAFFCSGVAQGMNYLAKYVWKYAGDKAFSALAAAGEFFKGFVFGLVKFTVLRKLGQYLLRWASGTKYYTVVTYVNKWLLKGPKHAR